MLRLADLAPSDLALPGRTGDTPVKGLTSDSRQVAPGDVFVAMSGARQDGRQFIADAISRGAAVIVVDGARSAALEIPTTVQVIETTEPRRLLARMAARLYPLQPETIVAVTGTSGKTSVAEFTRQVLANLGHDAASLGTIGVVRGASTDYGSLTTPDPVTLHRTLDRLGRDGVTHLAMEASSHGLDQYRLDGVRLRAAAFLNLGHDHLDYHPTVDAYLAAKLRLFTEVAPADAVAVINVDGPRSADALEAARRRLSRIITVGRAGETLRLADVVRDGFRQRITVAHAGDVRAIDLPLIGDYQAGNALVAAGLAMAAGAEWPAVAAVLPLIRTVRGRLDVVAEHNGGLVVVDYAHKPDALGAALRALRPFATRRLISVFGCGGDRDRVKRPIMGRISSELADVSIVTDDNPRSESAAAIRAEILAAAPGALERGDRAQAIRAAVRMMGPGDVVLIAGKGHEDGQIVGTTVLPFSDHAEALAAIGEIRS